MSSTHQYPFAKCGACGWLHVAMPAADAHKAVTDHNAARDRGGWPDRPAAYDRYLRCHRCGASTDQFVPALETDARHGATLHACVVEHAGLDSAMASRKVAPTGVPTTVSETKTISAFVEQPVRGAMNYRRTQAEFLVRGEQAWQTYLRTGQSRPAREVFDGIQSCIDARRQELAPPSAERLNDDRR